MESRILDWSILNNYCAYDQFHDELQKIRFILKIYYTLKKSLNLPKKEMISGFSRIPHRTLYKGIKCSQNYVFFSSYKNGSKCIDLMK